MLHSYPKLRLESSMPSSLNTKSTQLVVGMDGQDAISNLAGSHY